MAQSSHLTPPSLQGGHSEGELGCREAGLSGSLQYLSSPLGLLHVLLVGPTPQHALSECPISSSASFCWGSAGSSW